MVIALFLLNSVAHANNPFLDLKLSYLGQGEMVAPTGKKFIYSSYATGLNVANDNGTHTSLLTLGYFRNGKPLSYSLFLEWDAHSFAQAKISYVSAEGQAIDLAGVGYCSSNKCHISFVMDDKAVEETIIIGDNANTIERLGSIQYRDSAGTPQMAYWSEQMAALQPSL